MNKFIDMLVKLVWGFGWSKQMQEGGFLHWKVSLGEEVFQGELGKRSVQGGAADILTCHGLHGCRQPDLCRCGRDQGHDKRSNLLPRSPGEK